MPWGTAFDEAVRLFKAKQEGKLANATFLCDEVEGFKALSCELTAPGRDRPVLGAAFQLAPMREALWRPTYWADTIVAALGDPSEASQHDISDYANPSDGVSFYARWERDGFSVGLSLFGAPRAVEGGRSIGMLWLNWDEAKAALPLLKAWQARCAWLEGCASRATRMQSFVVTDRVFPDSLPPADDYPDEYPIDLPPDVVQHRALRLALQRPEMLVTPRAIATQLQPRGFALWACEADNIWCVSTRWDSLPFTIGSQVAVSWAELAAAKGPAYTELLIAEKMWLRSGDRCREIAAAAEWLRKMPGVTVQHHHGYNA